MMTINLIASERLPCGAAYLIDRQTGKARLVRGGEREHAFAMRDIAAEETFTTPITSSSPAVALIIHNKGWAVPLR